MSIVLTKKQQEALDRIVERYAVGERYTTISGYAGSGKTTVVRMAIEALGVNENEVVHATLTGKAAQVLQRKGNKNCETLHKLLYKTHMTPTGYIRQKNMSIPYKVVVVDEVSMVSNDMLNHLMILENNPYLIFLGDPYQLPPIETKDKNALLQVPHVFLDEIMRQAQESDIIKVSMDIREGKKLKPFLGKDIRIYSKKDFDENMLEWADQILVATHNQRREINDLVRSRMGRGPEPEIGDKIISGKNNWEKLSQMGESLVNGTIAYLGPHITSTFIKPPHYVKHKDIVPVFAGEITLDTGDVMKDMIISKEEIVTGNPVFDFQDQYQMGKRKRDMYKIPSFFEYGYAITVHRAQGSQWDNVLIFEDRFPFSREEHNRWLYSAVTRGAEKVVVILKD